jgi:hypothetical protein
MNPSQNWQRSRDQFKFNTSNSVRIKDTGEVGVIICTGEDDGERVYMIKLNNAATWDPHRTVKETNLESYLGQKNE